MKLSDMTTIETTHEAARCEFVYRVTVGSGFTIIKRASAVDPLWNHGAATFLYDLDAREFLPMIKVANPRLPAAVSEAVLAAL